MSQSLQRKEHCSLMFRVNGEFSMTKEEDQSSVWTSVTWQRWKNCIKKTMMRKRFLGLGNLQMSLILITLLKWLIPRLQPARMEPTTGYYKQLLLKNKQYRTRKCSKKCKERKIREGLRQRRRERWRMWCIRYSSSAKLEHSMWVASGQGTNHSTTLSTWTYRYLHLILQAKFSRSNKEGLSSPLEWTTLPIWL